MVKKVKKEKVESFKTITTPSPFGSHQKMVVETPEDVILKENEVVCKDDNGLYITLKNRLDNGLWDPRRTHSKKNRLLSHLGEK